jgi:hypothetical protein
MLRSQRASRASTTLDPRLPPMSSPPRVVASRTGPRRTVCWSTTRRDRGVSGRWAPVWGPRRQQHLPTQRLTLLASALPQPAISPPVHQLPGTQQEVASSLMEERWTTSQPWTPTSWVAALTPPPPTALTPPPHSRRPGQRPTVHQRRAMQQEARRRSLVLGRRPQVHGAVGRVAAATCVSGASPSSTHPSQASPSTRVTSWSATPACASPGPKHSHCAT